MKNRPYNFHITTLDRYIIRKFMGTYFFALLIIIGIVIIFDISEKIDDFVDKEAPLRAVVVDYYMNFIPYFMNMFSPLFVFISVIFFTSKLAGHSEIIAMLSGGISFNRIMYPYFLSALFIAMLSLALNWFVIPPANRNRLAFEEQYLKTRTEYNRNIHYQVEPDTYVYIESYNSWNNTASPPCTGCTSRRTRTNSAPWRNSWPRAGSKGLRRGARAAREKKAPRPARPICAASSCGPRAAPRSTSSPACCCAP